MEILIYLLVGWFIDGFLEDDFCNEYSACFIDLPRDPQAPKPCFFFCE